MTTGATIGALLDDWVEAERSADAEALGRLLAEEFVGIGPAGFVLDKEAWLGRFEMGLRYEWLELEENVTRRRGDSAFVVAHQRAHGIAGPNPTPSDLRLSVTIVTGDADCSGPRITAMHYSFIGMPD